MADETTTQHVIGRVAIIDETTGEQTPIDARTRAEAVEVEGGGNAQQKFDAMAEHIANPNIHSMAYVKPMWQVTIPAAGWLAVAPEGADFAYYIEVEMEGVLDTHNANVTVDVESVQVAAACGLCPTMETLHNKLKFWSRSVPASAILCHMTLFGEGGEIDAVSNQTEEG